MTRDLHYRIRPADPAAHLFEVACTVPDPDPAGQRFSLPAWTPGSYTIRDFARHVISFRASAGGRAVAVEKLDKDTWRCAPCAGPLTVACEIYAHDASVRAACLEPLRGFFTGTSVFLRPEGRGDRRCTLELVPPAAGAVRGAWRVATAMAPLEVDARGFGRYAAADYEELVDHPVEMGSFELAEFEVEGVPHRVAVSGRQRGDLERLCRDLARICAQHVALFGPPPPMDRYLFLLRVSGAGYGGLEHRASASLAAARDGLPRAEDGTVREAYRDLLGLFSHEYFHAWNVKRIRPAAFVPLDLGREAYTRLLWAFEGITSYYDDLALLRAGVIDVGSYLELLGRGLTRLARNPGRLRQSVVESSFDAWTRFYKAGENAPNAIVSYYNKGALIALALDLTLRRDGGCSLDEVMRALWARHGRTGEGVPEDGLERLAAELSGLDLQPFFDQALRGTGELPLGALLADFGVQLAWRPALSAEDRGGRPAPPDAPPGVRRVLGARVEPAEGGVRLAQVLDGGAARAAGLAAGDLIVAIDGIRTGAADLEPRLAACPSDTAVRVHAFRGDELLELELVPQPAPADTAVLTLVEDPGDAARARREAWLRVAASSQAGLAAAGASPPPPATGSRAPRRGARRGRS